MWSIIYIRFQWQIQTLTCECNNAYAWNVIINLWVNQLLVKANVALFRWISTPTAAPLFSNTLFCAVGPDHVLPTNKPHITQAQVVLNFINSNIRVLNVQRTSPMRIAFTVLANTERSSTRGTQSKSPGDRNIYQELQKEGVTQKTRNQKLYNIKPPQRQTGVPSVEVCVCTRVCVYTIVSYKIKQRYSSIY